MLEIKNVHKTFNKGTINEKKALNGVNLHLDPGDFVTIIGGNGAGKSTTLNMVAGVYPIDQGTIILDGKDISDLPEYKRAYMLGRVFQDPMMGTAAGMQIEENMAMANRRGKKRGLSWGITKKEKEDSKIVWALAIIGAIAAVAGIAFAVYKYLTPDYMDDFDEDFDDDFDDDFFDEEDDTDVKEEDIEEVE